MNKFWKKVIKCNHENLSSDYYAPVYCGTPYCGGDEVHCLDCGVYISRCGCGFCNDVSGWPEKRWKKLYDKRSEKIIGDLNEIKKRLKRII